MNYTEALEYIHSVSWKGSRPGLERTEELLRLMGNPERKLKFIHIAGTNGKGSTASMSASILQEAGYTTGLYTSPYVRRFNERMQIDGEQIADGELAEITECVRPFAEAMLAYIGTGALVLGDVNWVAALSAGGFGFISALLLALTGLPEVEG